MGNGLANVLSVTRNKNAYLALGVRPFVNCAFARSAGLMLPELRAAIAEASRQFASLDALMESREPPDSDVAPMSRLPVETLFLELAGSICS